MSTDSLPLLGGVRLQACTENHRPSDHGFYGLR
jgi:hypothetical protein